MIRILAIAFGAAIIALAVTHSILATPLIASLAVGIVILLEI